MGRYYAPSSLRALRSRVRQSTQLGDVCVVLWEVMKEWIASSPVAPRRDDLPIVITNDHRECGNPLT